jgi:hypothetical protein
MANKKISELVASTTLVNADLVPVVTGVSTSPATKKITVSDLKTQLFASPTLTGTTTTGPINATGTVAATAVSGNGAGLTNLPAANLTGTLPAISGASLTGLNASALASGSVPAARLPTSYAALTVDTLTTQVIERNVGGFTGYAKIDLVGGRLVGVNSSFKIGPYFDPNLDSDYLLDDTTNFGSPPDYLFSKNTAGNVTLNGGPVGTGAYNGSDRFIRVRVDSLVRYIRCEHWV